MKNLLVTASLLAILLWPPAPRSGREPVGARRPVPAAQAGFASGSIAAAPAHSVTVDENKTSADFPTTLTFSANFKSDSQIKAITLEYGTMEQTCGTVVAKAQPDFTPAKDVSVTWDWDMRQSGSLPPGATIWWQWVIEDASGVTRTPRQTVTWLDDSHGWQTIKGGNANLHWYRGDQAFGQQMHDAAVSAMQRMEQDTGLKADAPVDIYVYGTYDDLREAVLYEPGWTGGQPFPEANIVIIGISPDNAVWGRTAIAHELTHIMVGHLTFSCLTSVPTWVNEGLAVYSEGRLNPDSQKQFDQAVADNSLLSVRSLSGAFSEVPGRAYLSYSESYSLVKFLVETYGRAKMTDQECETQGRKLADLLTDLAAEALGRELAPPELLTAISTSPVLAKRRIGCAKTYS